jgi:hypothetical protein
VLLTFFGKRLWYWCKIKLKLKPKYHVMEKFVLDRQEDTPEIELNPETKTLFIKGVSMPEDAKVFYTPLMNCLKEYIQSLGEGETMIFKTEFKYFNSASAKIIHEILEEIPSRSIVLWCCPKEDDDMIEAGYGFVEILDNNLDFKIVTI